MRRKSVDRMTAALEGLEPWRNRTHPSQRFHLPLPGYSPLSKDWLRGAIAVLEWAIGYDGDGQIFEHAADGGDGEVR